MISKVSIIIVSYNGAEWLNKCLESVFISKTRAEKLSKGKIKIQVIVVDNASEDKSLEIVENFFEVFLIRLNKNQGFAAGNNFGIKRAMEQNSDAVILLNQDTEVEEDFIFEIIKTADSSDAIGIAQGMLFLGKERNLVNNVGNAMHYLGFGFVKNYRDKIDKWVLEKPFEIGYASGAAMIIKRKVIEEIGFFDESFFAYHEDLDLCWRAKIAGYKIILATSAVVYHYYEFSRNKKKFYWAEKNRIAALLKNYSYKTLIFILPMLVFVEILMLFYSLISGWFYFKIKSYFWVLCNLHLIFKSRKIIQSSRKLSDREIFLKMDYKIKFGEIDNFFINYFFNPVVFLYYKMVCCLI